MPNHSKLRTPTAPTTPPTPTTPAAAATPSSQSPAALTRTTAVRSGWGCRTEVNQQCHYQEGHGPDSQSSQWLLSCLFNTSSLPLVRISVLLGWMRCKGLFGARHSFFGRFELRTSQSVVRWVTTWAGLELKKSIFGLKKRNVKVFGMTFFARL